MFQQTITIQLFLIPKGSQEILQFKSIVNKINDKNLKKRTVAIFCKHGYYWFEKNHPIITFEFLMCGWSLFLLSTSLGCDVVIVNPFYPMGLFVVNLEIFQSLICFSLNERYEKYFIEKYSFLFLLLNMCPYFLTRVINFLENIGFS